MNGWVLILANHCFLLVENKIPPLVPTLSTYCTVLKKKLLDFLFLLIEKQAMFKVFFFFVLCSSVRMFDILCTVLDIVFLLVTIILTSLHCMSQQVRGNHYIVTCGMCHIIQQDFEIGQESLFITQWNKGVPSDNCTRESILK